MRSSRITQKSRPQRMFLGPCSAGIVFCIGLCLATPLCGNPLVVVCSALLARPATSGEKKDPENIRKVLMAKPPDNKVSRETMQKIYEEIKTPYKYGIILKGEQGKRDPAGREPKVDCPSVFCHGDTWYMMYIIFDGSGYETAIAESHDLLRWKPLGRIMRFREGTWDARQAAGYIALPISAKFGCIMIMSRLFQPYSQAFRDSLA